MRVLVAPSTEAARASFSHLQEWSRAGLLDPFCWWETDGDSAEEHLTVTRVVRGHEESMLLAEALTNTRPEEVALVGFCPIGSAEPVGPEYSYAVEDKVEAARQVLAFSKDRPVECTMVVVPGQIGLSVPRELFRAVWAANIYVVPEDRDDPQGVNALAANEARLPAHAAHAIATVADIWRGTDSGDVQILDRFEDPKLEPAPLQAVRCFTRGIDVGYLADHVAEMVFMPNDGWPNPDRQKYDRVSNVADVAAGGARAFVRKHQAVLGPTEFEPYEIPPDEKVGLWEALKRLVGIVIDRIRRRPIEFVVAKVYGVHDWMASKVEEIDGGATGLKVLRAGESARQGGSKVELEDALEGKIHRPDGPVENTWTDLRGVAFCLVDGRGLPDGIDQGFIDRGAKSALVSDPAYVVPDPEPGYSIITGERIKAICDPLQLDPSLQPKNEEAKDETDEGGDGEGASDEPEQTEATTEENAADGADGSGEPEPSTKGGAGDEDASVSTGDETSVELTQENAVEGEKAKPDADQIRARKSLLWLVGLELAKNIKKTREEAKRLREQIKALEQPQDKEAEEAEREELKQRSRKRIRDLIRVVLITFGVSAFVALLAIALLPLAVAIVCLLILPVLWLFVTANEARKMLITEKQESRALAQRGVDEMNLKLLAAIREGDVPRLERRYGEYLDWAEIVGWFVHHPWIGEPLEPISMDTAVPDGTRPAAFQMAIGKADPDLLIGLGKATRRHVFRPGWLNDLYSSNQTDVLEGPLGPAQLLDGELPEDVSDPAGDVSEDPDSPRRTFLRGIRRGDFRHVGDNAMTDDLIRRLDELPLDSAASEIVPTGEDPNLEPLPPSATWFSAPDNLDGLIRRLGPSTVRIKVDSIERHSTGTGVLLEGGELVVTAHHVVEGADSVAAVLADGTETAVILESVSAERDLAVLRLEARTDLPGADFGDPGAVDQGTPVVSLGFQGALEGEPTLSWGLITATQRIVSFDGVGDGVNCLEANYQSFGGNSGGAVFNLDGKVVGIHVGSRARRDSNEGLGHLSYAIPVDQLQDLIAAGHQSGAGSSWGRPSGAGPSVAMGAARRRKSTGPTPSDFFGELLSPSNAQVFHADHWRGATVENGVKDFVRIPDVGRVETSVVSDYCDGNEFLRPLRLMVHRIDIGGPIAPETLVSIELPDEPEAPPPSQTLL